MSSPSKGAIPPAPSPTWRFELLHPGCVHQTQFITKSFFLFIDSISVFLLLVLSGRLLRHRWKAQRRREERWGAQAHEGDGGEKEGSAAGKRTWERWQWYWTAVLGCGTGGRTAATTTRTTIGDLLERLVRTCVDDSGLPTRC